MHLHHRTVGELDVHSRSARRAFLPNADPGAVLEQARLPRIAARRRGYAVLGQPVVQIPDLSGRRKLPDVRLLARWKRIDDVVDVLGVAHTEHFGRGFLWSGLTRAERQALDL